MTHPTQGFSTPHAREPHGNLVDITGHRFNRLIVIKRANNVGQTPKWECVCDCGNKSVVAGNKLKSGRIKSCGCYVRQLIGQRSKTHGLSRRPMYLVWNSMMQRCYNPKDCSYKNYGARGIYVCDRWRESPANFIADMGVRPSPKHSIDRVDNDGPYAPENCRWATKTEQNNNLRTNRILTHNGMTQTVSVWARELGINKRTIRARLDDLGWPVEKALTATINRTGKPTP